MPGSTTRTVGARLREELRRPCCRCASWRPGQPVHDTVGDRTGESARDAPASRGTASANRTGPRAPGHHPGSRPGNAADRRRDPQHSCSHGRTRLDPSTRRGKGRSWHLSAAVYRVLDAPAGYVRVHGFEPLQQEQMVLQHVDAHGQITRTEAANLCSLTPDQASRLLRRLAKERKLVLRGQRRGSEYIRPSR